MKRLSIYAFAAVASIFVLDGCQKEVLNSTKEEVSKGQAFELFASAENTKTTNNGLDTDWKDGDALTVFHAEAESTTEYGSNDKFTLDGTNRFTGTLTEALVDGKSYDWYALYPYTSQIVTPANTSKGYCYIGSSGKSVAQVQNGNDSKAHLAGKYFPLYGKKTGVDKATGVSIEMKQALAVIKFEVTNNSGAPLVVSSIKFTASEDIIGSYYINFAGDNATFTKSGDDYVSSTATLNVKDGAEIENGNSANFYLAVKPFSAQSCTLKVAVNGYEKDLIIGSTATQFSSSVIRRIKFNYDKEAPKITAGNYIILAKESNVYYAISSDANGTSSRRDRVSLSDYTGGDSYSTDNKKIIWKVSQVTGGYNIQNYAEGDTYFGAGKNVIYMVNQENASTLSAINTSGNIWVIGGTVDKETRYVAMNGTSGFGFYASSDGVILVPATYVALPTWEMGDIADLEYNNISKNEKDVTTTATSATVAAYTSTSYETECDWLTVAYDATNKKFSYTATQNGSTERTAYVKIVATNDCGTKTYYTTIKQKASGPTLNTWTYAVIQTSSTFNSENSVTVEGATWTITMGDVVGTPTTNGTPSKYTGIYGWKWGNSSSNYWKSYTLSTDYFTSKKVKSVTVNFLNNGSKSATMVVKQTPTEGSAITIGTTTQKFGNTWTDLTANTTQGNGGTLTIEYSVAQASYIHSITVKYYD